MVCGLPPSRVPLCTQVVISPVYRLCHLVNGIPPAVGCTVGENVSFRLRDHGLCPPRSISIKSVPRGDPPAYTEAIRLQLSLLDERTPIVLSRATNRPLVSPQYRQFRVRKMAVMCRGCSASCVGSASFALDVQPHGSGRFPPVCRERPTAFVVGCVRGRFSMLRSFTQVGVSPERACMSLNLAGHTCQRGPADRTMHWRPDAPAACCTHVQAHVYAFEIFLWSFIVQSHRCSPQASNPNSVLAHRSPESCNDAPPELNHFASP